jgi:hypothetical protein
MKRWHWDLALFILATPILALRGVIRFVRHFLFLRATIEPTIVCRTCRKTIDLLGMWKCSCGYVAEGHLLRFCPGCHSFPTLIRCYQCGATQVVSR